MGSIVLFIIIILFFIILFGLISIFNKYNKLKIKIDESLSSIDVSLAKRYDVLTKMIEVVKGYAKHEKETLFEVVNLRKNMSVNEKADEDKKMDYNIDKINILKESYPKLKANENFLELQKTIYDVEEHLQASRRFYNSNVAKYNELIYMFPSNIVAKIFSFKKIEYFKATDEEKENVKIEEKLG